MLSISLEKYYQRCKRYMFLQFRFRGFLFFKPTHSSWEGIGLFFRLISTRHSAPWARELLKQCHPSQQCQSLTTQAQGALEPSCACFRISMFIASTIKLQKWHFTSTNIIIFLLSTSNKNKNHFLSFFFFFSFSFLTSFLEAGSLCTDCPGSHSVEQAGLFLPSAEIKPQLSFKNKCF